MADDTGRPGPPPVGSVAEEAARLLDALGGWAGAHGYGAPGAAAEDPVDGRAPEADRADEDGGAAYAGAGGSPAAEDHGPRSPRCEHCGAAVGATGAAAASSCQWCPVCQGLDLLRSVRPETVERLADLAGAIAAALRDVAARGHGQHGPAAGTQSGGSQSGGRGSHAGSPASRRTDRVQDITIEDEDQGSATV